ncbi:hypothetical protein ACVWW6_006023 [Bradyrhizobium sp. USDA 3311]
MAKLPDLATFSSRVGVEGPRAVGSYDLSPLARGNAAMTQGVETLGKGVQAVGNDVAAAAEANDRYSLAIAKASFNIDHSNLQDGLKHDQDYATLQPRYMEQAQALQTKWADTLSNPNLRARFNAETGQSIASTNSVVKDHAWTLEGNTKLADIEDRGKALSDAAIADPMNEAKFGTGLQNYGDMVDAMVAKGWLTPTQAAQKKDAWAHSAGVGVGLARADIDPTGALNEVRAAPGTPEQIDNRIMHVEGPGKDPRSSAVGGFIDQTWLDLVRAKRPDLAAGKSDADILALRADAGLRTEMTRAYREENSAALKAQGLPATPGNIYLAHFLGPGAATAVLKAPPGKPVADVLMDVYGDPRKVQRIIDANPKVLGGQLAGSVVNWANGRMGGAVPGGNHLYDWLDDNQRRQIAGYAQNKIDALQLDQQSTLKQRVEDTAAEAARTGYATNPVTQSEFVAAKGVVDGPKAYAEYQAGLKTAADISNLARMSMAEQDELLRSYEPKPGEGYAAAAERQDAIRKAIVAVRKERDADPATFAINRVPAVKAAFDNFSEISRDQAATPEAKSLAARDYVNKATERQLAAGVAPEDVKVVPAGYVDNLDKAFTSVATSEDPQARVGLIARVNQEKALWGDVWPKVMGQLPATTQPIVRAIAAGANPVAMSRLLSLPPKESPVAILKEQDEVTARNMMKATNAAMAPWRSTLVGPQQEAYFNGYNGLVQKLAALYIRDGNTSAETAATNAFNAVIGDRYEIRDTWRLPKDPKLKIDADAVQLGTLIARQELERGPRSEDSAAQAAAELKLTPQEQALYARHLTNLRGPGGVDNADGSRSTLYQSVVEHNGRFYNVPTVWNGKIEAEKFTRPSDGKVFDVPNATAKRNIESAGWDSFPSYATAKEADDRYEAMHKYMEQDTARYRDARAGSPFGSLRLQVNDLGVSDNEADSRRNFARNGVFVTSPNEDGLNIAYNTASSPGFVSDKDGKRILLTWDQLAKIGGSKEARDAAFIASINTAAPGL